MRNPKASLDERCPERNVSAQLAMIGEMIRHRFLAFQKQAMGPAT